MQHKDIRSGEPEPFYSQCIVAFQPIKEDVFS